MKTKLHLNDLKSNYVDLSGYGAKVVVTGEWINKDRLVLKDYQGGEIRFDNALIDSTHPEDALVLSGDWSNTDLVSINTTLLNGGITAWGSCENVKIKGFTILYPHTGIRINQPFNHKNIWLIRNMIRYASHEGIYLGVTDYNKDYPVCEGAEIKSNVIEHCGWDAIQVGNWRGVHIGGNKINHPARARRFGQSHAITINPNSQVWVFDDNEIVHPGGDTIQVNSATAYQNTITNKHNETEAI